MHKIHIKYYILLSVVIVFGIAAGLFYFYGVVPLDKRVQRKEQSISETAEGLSDRGWPGHPERLQRLLKKRRKESDLLKDKAKQLNKLVDTTFRDRIMESFGAEAVQNPSTFRQYVSRLDYQEFYTSIISEWKSRNIFLSEELINLSKNTVSSHIYRLILKLWSLDTILNLATENGLSVVTVPESAEPAEEADSAGLEANAEAGEGDDKASLVQLPRVREYYLAESEEEPYLLGLPVVMEVTCTTGELMDFLRSLSSYDSLVVLNHIDIKKQPPQNGGKDYRNSLRVKLSCSTFYRL